MHRTISSSSSPPPAAPTDPEAHHTQEDPIDHIDTTALASLFDAQQLMDANAVDPEPGPQPTFVEYETLGRVGCCCYRGAGDCGCLGEEFEGLRRRRGDDGQDGLNLRLRLVGWDPLWGHLLWHASRIIARYLEHHAPTLVRDKTVLEFGAGAGLPSLVCGLALGARKVVMTDYPDADLVENMRWNVAHCLEGRHDDFKVGEEEEEEEEEKVIVVEGYLWGNDPANLLAHLPANSNRTSSSPSPSPLPNTTNSNIRNPSHHHQEEKEEQEEQEERFTLLLLSDLLFNHSEHQKLITSIQNTLDRTSPQSRALVFFTPHRPWLLDRDMAFFDLARDAGFTVQKVVEGKMRVGGMVTEGDVDVDVEGSVGGGGYWDTELRRTVFGYELRWLRD